MMKFHAPLIKGTLVKRYKRFMADVELADGEVVTAHCPNPGAMLGLKDPGLPAYLTPAKDPNRKLKYTLEALEVDGQLVGINTGNPNKIVKEALETAALPEFSDYKTVRPEVKYGENSRVDFLLTQDGHSGDLPDCYVEVKNVHLMREAGLAEFPDSVTARGAKHLQELSNMVAQGHRAVMFYLVQRMDADRFAIASDIDSKYATEFERAVAAGIEIVCYSCHISEEGIALAGSLPMAESQTGSQEDRTTG